MDDRSARGKPQSTRVDNICGRRGGKRDDPARRRVRKRQLHGMQERARRSAAHRAVLRGVPVSRVARYRTAQLRRMYADLVHTTRLDVKPDERKSAVPGQDLPMRDRPQTVPTDRTIQRSLRGFRCAVQNGEIGLADIAVVLELTPQPKVGPLGLREDHYAARSDVEPVHDAGPLGGSDPRHAGPRAHELFGQRPRLMTG